MKDGTAAGLEPGTVESFFRAQIEEQSCAVRLLAEWRRSGAAPAHAPINLVMSIRPQLDQLQSALIEELKDAAAIRASATCSTGVAKAAGKYTAAHKHDVDPLEAIALDRALAATCE